LRTKTSTPVGTRGREYKMGNTNPGSLCASEVGSIEVMPQVPKEMWPENIRQFLLFLFLESLDPKWLNTRGPKKIGTIIP
jgi:hypothetical protein